MGENAPTWPWTSMSTVNMEYDDDTSNVDIEDEDFLTGSRNFKSYSKSMVEKKTHRPIEVSSIKSTPKKLTSSMDNTMCASNQLLSDSQNSITSSQKAILNKWRPFLTSEKELRIGGYFGTENRFCVTKPIIRRISSNEVASENNNYILQGPAVQSNNKSLSLPPDIHDKFLDGFPVNWKEIIQTWQDSVKNHTSPTDISQKENLVSGTELVKNTSSGSQKNCSQPDSTVPAKKIEKPLIPAEKSNVENNQSLEKLKNSEPLNILQICRLLEEYFQEKWIPFIRRALISPDCSQSIFKVMDCIPRLMERLKAENDISIEAPEEEKNTPNDAGVRLESSDEIVQCLRLENLSSSQNEGKETLTGRAENTSKKKTQNKNKEKKELRITVERMKINTNEFSDGIVSPTKPESKKKQGANKATKTFSVGKKENAPVKISAKKTLGKKNENCSLGSLENPMLLRQWRPKLVKDYELAFEGTLLDVKSRTPNGFYCSDPIQRRVNAHLLKMTNDKYIKLIGRFSNKDHHMPQEDAHHFFNGCPVNFESICKNWKLKTKRKSTKSKKTKLLEDSIVIRTSKRGRFVLPPLAFWEGQRSENVRRSTRESMEESPNRKKRRIEEKSSNPKEKNTPNAPSNKEKKIVIDKKLESKTERRSSNRTKVQKL